MYLFRQSDDVKKHLLFFGIVSAFGLFIMMGSLNPLNLLFAEYIPFFVTLFSLPYFFGGIFVVLGFSVLAGFSIAWFFSNSLKGIKRKCLKGISIVLVFLLIGVYGFPIWSGEFIYPGNELMGSSRYDTPLYYQDAREWLDGQENNFRLFALPYSKLGYMAYTWPPAGFNGPDPSPSLLNRDIVTGTGFGLNFANELAEFNISGLSKMLGIMNIKYVLVHNDANLEFMENNSWYISSAPQFSKLNLCDKGTIQPYSSFGELDFYKISDDNFRSHIYPAAPILVQGSINDMFEVVNSDNFTIGNNALFLSDQISESQLELLKEYISVENNDIPTITFQKINPTRYEIKVENATNPFFIVFLDSYHPEWEAHINRELYVFNEMITQYNNTGVKETKHEMKLTIMDISYLFKNPIHDNRHFLVNGYANAWYIDPLEHGIDENFTVTLYFKPQSYFYIGLIISGFTFIGCGGYLFWDRRKRKTAKLQI